MLDAPTSDRIAISTAPRADPSGIDGPWPRRSKALVFAWMVEAVAVGMGLVLAIYAGIEGSDSGPFAILVACLPFLALAVVELTKIPLVGLIFAVRSRLLRLMAVAALLLVTVATFENFVFGFERGFNERLRAVATADQAVAAQANALALARGRLPELTARQAELTGRLATLREETAEIRRQAQDDIADTRRGEQSIDVRGERERLARELAAVDSRRDAELLRERRRCAANPGLPCGLGYIENRAQRERTDINGRLRALGEEERRRSAEAQQDIGAARQARDAALAAKEQDRAQAQAALEQLRPQLAAAEATVLGADDRLATLGQRRDELIERSQLHRLAAIMFGNHEAASLEQAKRLFVGSLAAIVALVGTVVAAMYYAAQQPQRERRAPLGRALRGLLLRLRRALPALPRRRQPAPERIKLVYLPLDASEAQLRAARQAAIASS